MHKPDQLCGVSAKENATFIGAFCVCVCFFVRVETKLWTRKLAMSWRYEKRSNVCSYECHGSLDAESVVDRIIAVGISDLPVFLPFNMSLVPSAACQARTVRTSIRVKR